MGTGASIAAKILQIINADVPELSIIVNEELNTEIIGKEKEIINILGLSFNRACGVFLEAQELVNSTVLQLVTKICPNNEDVNFIHHQNIITTSPYFLLYIAWWNICKAKSEKRIPILHQTQFIFLELKKQFSESKWSKEEQLHDVEKCLAVVNAQYNKDTEYIYIESMLKLSVHYYALSNTKQYQTAMLFALKAAFNVTNAENHLSFTICLIMLIVHTEWEPDNGMTHDVLSNLLTHRSLPEWMHSWALLEPLSNRFMKEYIHGNEFKKINVNHLTNQIIKIKAWDKTN